MDAELLTIEESEQTLQELILTILGRYYPFGGFKQKDRAALARYIVITWLVKDPRLSFEKIVNTLPFRFRQLIKNNCTESKICSLRLKHNTGLLRTSLIQKR